MKKIDLLEFKRDTDSSESYYQDMWKVSEKQHTPILTGLKELTSDREWEVERSFGLGKKMGRRSSID